MVRRQRPKKSSEKETAERRIILQSAITYKQALRGLFVTGTSDVASRPPAKAGDKRKGRLMNQD